MKWAVYWQHEDEIECAFFRTEDQARLKVEELCLQCEAASADAEKNLDWDITLLCNMGEVHWGPDGLRMQVVTGGLR